MSAGAVWWASYAHRCSVCVRCLSALPTPLIVTDPALQTSFQPSPPGPFCTPAPGHAKFARRHCEPLCRLLLMLVGHLPRQFIQPDRHPALQAAVALGEGEHALDQLLVVLAGPQQLGAEPRSGYRPADTLVGGIAPVPPPGPPLPKQDEPDDSSTTASPSSSSSPAPKRKRGRSKLMMVAVVLLGGAAVAYGAGLLLGHDDVPRGTSVLGVEIGGQTRDEAVKTLDGVLTRRTTAALPVKIGDASSELDPQVAGLSIDTTVTVRNAAHRDYNPVTVIGSLFGQKRLIEPQVNVDEDKLRGALETLSASAGNGRQEGGVKFVSGKAVAIQPKAGLGAGLPGI